MTEQQTDRPRLWTKDGFADDAWTRVATLEEAGNARAILPLGAYVALDEQTRRDGRSRIGVELQPGEQIDAILPFLESLPVVALAFPAFNDGRSYSKAQLLRTRHGYEGEIRATGDVLIDQIPHMLRTGFTAFEVTNPTALARLEAGRVGGLPNHYQPAAVSETAGAAYSWRRVPAA